MPCGFNIQMLLAIYSCCDCIQLNKWGYHISFRELNDTG